MVRQIVRKSKLYRRAFAAMLMDETTGIDRAVLRMGTGNSEQGFMVPPQLADKIADRLKALQKDD